MASLHLTGIIWASVQASLGCFLLASVGIYTKRYTDLMSPEVISKLGKIIMDYVLPFLLFTQARMLEDFSDLCRCAPPFLWRIWYTGGPFHSSPSVQFCSELVWVTCMARELVPLLLTNAFTWPWLVFSMSLHYHSQWCNTSYL